MPYRRNYKKRKQAPRPYRRVYKKKAFQRKARAMTKFTNVKKNLYYFKRKIPSVPVNLANQNGQASYLYQFINIPNYTELTALFDQYQIKGIKMNWRLVLDPAAQSANLASYPALYVRRDYDNAAIESVSDIMQDNRSKRIILRPDRVSGMYLKPSTLDIQNSVDVNGNTVQTQYPVWNKWIDCSDPRVPHYGMKIAVDAQGIDLSGFRLITEFTYYVAMKNTR